MDNNKERRCMVGICECGVVTFMAAIPVNDSAVKELEQYKMEGGEAKAMPVSQATESFGKCKCSPEKSLRNFLKAKCRQLQYLLTADDLEDVREDLERIVNQIKLHSE